MRTTEIDWYLRFGKEVDRRPVELRVRAVRRARLPAVVAVKTVTYALRRGDRGVSLAGNSERRLRTPAGRRPALGIDLQFVHLLLHLPHAAVRSGVAKRAAGALHGLDDCLVASAAA